MDMLKEIISQGQELQKKLEALDEDARIEAINELKKMLHAVSPFKAEPVDCVVWVKNESVEGNAWNPNRVAPPEMELLETSIAEDGYTQPLVTWIKEDQTREVVDGFHRNLVGKTSDRVQQRVRGYLPVATINDTHSQKSDRMASTIRHNRARGTHNIELMSTIVAELVEMGKGDRWICQHIGMSADELLRLKQITGVAALFANREFSDSWEADSEGLAEFERQFEDSAEQP
jgi:ParB-like chromosome segregation protein Spo0J